jgi:hypothetical protein
MRTEAANNLFGSDENFEEKFGSKGYKKIEVRADLEHSDRVSTRIQEG